MTLSKQQRVQDEEVQLLQVWAELENSTDEISQYVLAQQDRDERRSRQKRAQKQMHLTLTSTVEVQSEAQMGTRGRGSSRDFGDGEADLCWTRKLQTNRCGHRHQKLRQMERLKQTKRMRWSGTS